MRRLRHLAYVVTWCLLGNTHHTPPTHGRHDFGGKR